MSIQTKVQVDLHEAIKFGYHQRRDVLKVIVGELQRQQNKVLGDDDVIKILKKLEKSELELLEKTGETSSFFLDVLHENLPQMVTEADIEQWILDNIDWSAFKNKMQAVGVVMKHFGASADGNQVRAIIQRM